MPNSSPSKTEPAHSRLSPSASKRWVKCQASVGFIEANRDKIGPEVESVYAAEGTDAHTYAQRLLLGEKRVPQPNSEMRACIEEGYVPFVQAEAKKLGLSKFKVELRVPLFYDRSQRGTCDAPLLSDVGIKVVDLKYGAGVSVEAKFNTQLAIYGESLIQEEERRRGKKFKPGTPVELIIYQPRAKDNRFVRRWELTRGELAEFCAHIQEAAHAIIMEEDDLPFHADSETTCRWCPAKPFCAHHAAHLLEELPPSVAKPLSTVEHRLRLPEPEGLTDSQMLRILLVADDVRAWLLEMEKHMTARAVKGHKYAGLKLVESQKHRKWADEKEAVKVLRGIFPADQLYSQSFKSPSQIGDLLKGLKKKPATSLLDRIAKLIIKPKGEPRLAVRDDPAEEVSELL